MPPPMQALASASAGPRSNGSKQPNPTANSMRHPMPRGRGRAMTRPSWASLEAFATLLGEHSAAAMAEQEREAELRALVTDGNDGAGAEAPPAPPVVTPILSRTLVLKNAFNPKRLAKNPYVQNADDDDAGPPTAFPDVEKYYISLCCQFGYVRYASASVEDGSVCVVKVGFATKEGAKNCIDALHGMPMAWQQQLVADYDLIGEAAKSVSKAIWIGNVFAPFTCKEELEDTEAEAARRGRPPYLAEMESDFTCECSRFGPVTRVVASASEGAVHVVFGSVVSAADCVSAMNGRWFEERLMWAEFDLDFDEDYIREEAASTNAQHAGATPPPLMGTAEEEEYREDNDDDDDRRYRSSSSSTSTANRGSDSIAKRSLSGGGGETASSKRPFKAATLETTTTLRRATNEPDKGGLKTVALPASLLATFGDKREAAPARGSSSHFGLLPSSSSSSAPLLNPYASLAQVRPSSSSPPSPSSYSLPARPPTPPRPSFAGDALPGAASNTHSSPVANAAPAALANFSFSTSLATSALPSATSFTGSYEPPSAFSSPSSPSSSSSATSSSSMPSFSSYAAIAQKANEENEEDATEAAFGSKVHGSSLLGLADYGSDDNSD